VIYRLAYLSSSYYPDGRHAEWGRNSLAALELAIKNANRESWCGKNCRFELTIFEVNGTISPALDTFITSAITNIKPVAFLGADWSRIAVHISGLLKSRNSTIPVISAGATSALLEKASNHPNFLRTCYSDRYAPIKLLEILANRHAQAAEISSESVIKFALIHSAEPYGTGAATVIQDVTIALNKSGHHREIISIQSFDSGANVVEVRLLIRKLLNISNDPKNFFIYISCTGPDTTTVFSALAAEGISAKNWTIGAIEAADSVAKYPEDIKNAAGYISYLAEKPKAGTCAVIDNFTQDFNKTYNRLPTGGFAEFSYDLIVLVTAGLRAASGTNKNLLSILRSPDFPGAQGLSGVLKFPQGENQPQNNAVSFLELMENGESTKIEVNTSTGQLCPIFSIGLLS